MKTYSQKCSSTQLWHLLPLLALLLVWGGFAVRLEAAYKYPIGIPKAWIDPDVERPARPDPWVAEVPGYYFVDNENGVDSGRTYGYPGTPRKTIPATIPAGSYVEITGTYLPGASNTTITYINGAGNSGPWVAGVSGPAWVVGLNAEDRASFATRLIFQGSYLCVEYIDNVAGYGKIQFATDNASAGYAANHMLVRNCEFDGGRVQQSGGVGFAANKERGANNIIFHSNHVHHFGLWNTPAEAEADGVHDPDAAGMRVGNYAHDIWILNNTVHDCSGSGIGCASLTSGPAPTYNIYAGKNHVYNTWAAGMAVKTARNVVYSENIIHDIIWTSWSGAKCIGAQYAIESLWILYNHCYNGELGVKVGSTTTTQWEKIYVIGNLIHDIYDDPENPNPSTGSAYSGAITIWGGDERVVVGNTISNCINGIAFPVASADDPLTCVIENNIVANAKFNHISVELRPENSHIYNNLLFQSGSQAKVRLGNHYFTTDSANALTYVSGLIEANPLFGDTSIKDFSITSASPAKNAALSPQNLQMNVYAAFLNEFGVPLNVDKSGIIRPQGSNWDIGAYEFIDVNSKKIPKPTGASVDTLVD
jgi:Right handed beta helix region